MRGPSTARGRNLYGAAAMLAAIALAGCSGDAGEDEAATATPTVASTPSPDGQTGGETPTNAETGGDTETGDAPSATSSPADGGSAPAEIAVSGEFSFAAPSGNVLCTSTGADSVACTFADNQWQVPPEEDAACENDIGKSIGIADGEARLICQGGVVIDFADPGSERTTWWQESYGTVTSPLMRGEQAVLPYGSSIVTDSLECEMAESGVTCRDLGGGAQFTASAESYEIIGRDG